jgi:hypothetical protein
MASGLEILALVDKNNPGLLASYARAYESLGCNVVYWDPLAALRRHTKFGRLGRYVTNFVPVDAWILKMNRELIIQASERSPDLLLIVANTPIRAGTLAQIRIITAKTRIVLVWPDTLLNLTRHALESLPIYDFVATYSSSSIDPFRRLGASHIEWFPFAADPLLFPFDVDITGEERHKLASDICFIGSHNPEREEAILALVKAGFAVKVWGEPSSWRRHARDKSLLPSCYQGSPLFGASFAKAVRSAKLSLNVIDPTNYPAANMRFFESPACGGATLNSACPEMDGIFRDREHAFYYRKAGDLPSIARELIADEPLRKRVSRAGHELVLREHTYAHRAVQLLDRVGLAARR